MYGRQQNDERKDVRGPVEHPKTNCFSISVSMYGCMCRLPPFTCALSEARAQCWFAKKRTGIGLLYDVSIKGVPVSNGASVAPGDQITALLGMPRPTAPR